MKTKRNNVGYKYGISQSDMYQMFAYGHKYLKGTGTVYLIYPKHEHFNQPLPAFRFDDELTVRVIPYDLIKDESALIDQVLTMLPELSG
nr:hypothetical protein [Photobacterium proteolyticum]